MRKLVKFNKYRRIYGPSLIYVFVFSVAYTEAGQWSPPLTIENNADAQDIVYTCAINSTNQIFATWSENDTYIPKYSIGSFLNGVWEWSTEDSINTDGAKRVTDNVITSYVAATNQIFAVWGAYNTALPISSTYVPTYSVASYSNGAWSWSSLGAISALTKVYKDINLAVASSSNQVVAVWSDRNNQYYPTFSVASYAGGVWSWVPATVLRVGSTISVSENVSICYAAQTNQMVASWAEYNNVFPLSSTYYPYYSIATQANDGSWTWSTPAVLNTHSTSGVEQNVYLSYLSGTNQIVAVWNDFNNHYYPTYSIASYINGVWTWSLPAVLNQSGISQAQYDVICSYATATNQVFATWNDFNNDFYPTYSIASFTNGGWSWSLPTVISNTIPVYQNGLGAEGQNVFPCYLSSTNQVISTWLSTGSTYPPYYSLYFAEKGQGNGVSLNGSSGTGGSVYGNSGNGVTP